MKQVVIYGSGCGTCKAIEQMVRDTAQELGVAVDVSENTDQVEAMTLGIASRPALVIDGKVVHEGGKPDAAALQGWLAT